jgi:hypothetical protein
VRIAFGLMIESLVAILLLVTIGYCMLLNRRLKLLKADEQSLKATIAELIAGTENAERAIAGLKLTAQDCDRTLGDRLRTAERLSADLEQQITGGQGICERIARIVSAARPLQEPLTTTAAPDPRAVAAAAQAFADRARSRRNAA